MKPKSKKEIIEAATAIIACYRQDGEVSTIPYYSLPGKDEMLKKYEIIDRWKQLITTVEGE